MSTRHLSSITRRNDRSFSLLLVEAKKLPANNANLPSLNLLHAVCEPFANRGLRGDTRADGKCDYKKHGSMCACERNKGTLPARGKIRFLLISTVKTSEGTVEKWDFSKLRDDYASLRLCAKRCYCTKFVSREQASAHDRVICSRNEEILTQRTQT